MEDPSQHGWSIGYGIGGTLVALLFMWPEECLTVGPLPVPVEWNALGEAQGQIECTSYLGLSTMELDQAQTFFAAVLVGCLFAGAFEVYAWLKRRNSAQPQPQ